MTKLTLRQLWSDGTITISLFVAILVSGVFLTSTPLLFEQLSDDALVHTLETPPPSFRNLTVSLTSRIGSVDNEDAFGGVENAGSLFLEREFSPEIQAVVEEQRYVVDSSRFVISPWPGDEPPLFPAFIRMRYQQGIADEVRITEGAFPETRADVILREGPGCNPVDLLVGTACQKTETEVPLYELAVTQATLDEIGVSVGDRLVVAPDPEDELYRNRPASALDFRLVIEISGTIELLEPEAEFWYGDDRLHQPRIVENADFVFVYATGLMAPADYKRLLSDNGLTDWLYQWRFFLDSEMIAAGDVDEFLAEVRNLEINRTSNPPRGTFGLSTQLSKLIEDYVNQRGLTVALLSMAAIGLFVVALAVVALLSVLGVDRQRTSLLLLRSRGESSVQLAISRLAQGLILAIPPALAAYVLATLLAGAA